MEVIGLMVGIFFLTAMLWFILLCIDMFVDAKEQKKLEKEYNRLIRKWKR